MPEMRAARVWELDLPTGQEAKRAALARVLPAPPGHVTYAPIDLAGQRVAGVLAAAGADLGAPTLAICEAVSHYLPAVAVDEVLAYAGSLPAGSRFVFTYLPRSVAEDPRHARWARRLRWQSSFDPAELSMRLTGLGLTVLADLGADEHRERLLRPLGRTMDVFPGERIVIAARSTGG
jgi:methyltransferase (TIGR00027 family)